MLGLEAATAGRLSIWSAPGRSRSPAGHSKGVAAQPNQPGRADPCRSAKTAARNAAKALRNQGFFIVLTRRDALAIMRIMRA